MVIRTPDEKKSAEEEACKFLICIKEKGATLQARYLQPEELERIEPYLSIVAHPQSTTFELEEESRREFSEWVLDGIPPTTHYINFLVYQICQMVTIPFLQQAAKYIAPKVSEADGVLSCYLDLLLNYLDGNNPEKIIEREITRLQQSFSSSLINSRGVAISLLNYLAKDLHETKQDLQLFIIETTQPAIKRLKEWQSLKEGLRENFFIKANYPQIKQTLDTLQTPLKIIDQLSQQVTLLVNTPDLRATLVSLFTEQNQTYIIELKKLLQQYKENQLPAVTQSADFGMQFLKRLEKLFRRSETLRNDNHWHISKIPLVYRNVIPVVVEYMADLDQQNAKELEKCRKTIDLYQQELSILTIAASLKVLKQSIDSHHNPNEATIKKLMEEYSDCEKQITSITSTVTFVNHTTNIKEQLKILDEIHKVLLEKYYRLCTTKIAPLAHQPFTLTLPFAQTDSQGMSPSSVNPIQDPTILSTHLFSLIRTGLELETEKVICLTSQTQPPNPIIIFDEFLVVGNNISIPGSIRFNPQTKEFHSSTRLLYLLLHNADHPLHPILITEYIIKQAIQEHSSLKKEEAEIPLIISKIIELQKTIEQRLCLLPEDLNARIFQLFKLHQFTATTTDINVVINYKCELERELRTILQEAIKTIGDNIRNPHASTPYVDSKSLDLLDKIARLSNQLTTPYRYCVAALEILQEYGKLAQPLAMKIEGYPDKNLSPQNTAEQTSEVTEQKEPADFSTSAPQPPVTLKQLDSTKSDLTRDPSPSTMSHAGNLSGSGTPSITRRLSFLSLFWPLSSSSKSQAPHSDPIHRRTKSESPKPSTLSTIQTKL